MTETEVTIQKEQKKRSIKTTLLYLALIVLAGVIVYQWYRMGVIAGNYDDYIARQDDTISHYRKNGLNHSVKTIEQVPLSVYKNSQDSFIRELRKETKAKNLLIAANARLQARGSFTTKIHDTTYIDKTGMVVTDSTKHYFEWSDNYLTQYGVIDDSTQDISIDYAINIPIGFKGEWKRPKWWKKKELVADFSTPNTKVTFTDIRTIVIKQPPKKFYETRAFSFALGIVAGIVIAK